MTELLDKVDWAQSVATAAGIHKGSEADRVALLVLSLNRHIAVSKEAAKIVRMALRDIEKAVLECEQDIDYL